MRRLLQHPFVKRHLSVAAILRALRQPVFLTLILSFLGLWGFAELAEAVDEGVTERYDEAVLRAVRDPDDPESLIGPAWVDYMVRDFTSLGGEPVLAMLTTILCVFFVLAGRRDLSRFTLFAVIGGAVLTFVLKDVFDRPRPDVVPHMFADPGSASFPSGHAMASAFVFLTLGAIVMEAAPTRPLKIYAMAVAVFLTLLIGTTRVLLGVHYPTDVLAGWAAGLLWAYAARSALRLARFLWGFRRAKENMQLPPPGESAVMT